MKDIDWMIDHTDVPQPAEVAGQGVSSNELGLGHLNRALLMLTEGYDGHGFHYDSLADRISYATAAIRSALVLLGNRELPK